MFISEGSANEKLSSIKKNEYLSFCYDSLRKSENQLEIYGHSLNSQVDGHIIDAIKESYCDDIVYYKHKLNDMNESKIKQLKVRLESALEKDIILKDSSEHKLSKSWCIFSPIEDEPF